MSTRDVSSITHNIENVLLFGAVQHISRLLASVTDWPGALLLCALVAACDHALVAWRRSLASCMPRQLLSQINVIVFSRKLFERITTSAEAMRYTESSGLSLLAFARSTIVLIVVAYIPRSASEDAYRARIESLLLFMYTENLEVHASRLNARMVLLAVAVLVYVYVHALEDWIAQSQLRRYVARAVNMLAINSMLQIVTAHELARDTQTGLILLVLVLLEASSAAVPMLAELQSYALWKAARHLQQLYSEQLHDTELLLAASCLLLVLRHQARMKRTASELLVLVSVNVLVQHTVPDTTHDHTLVGLVVLLVYVVMFKVLTHTGVLA